MCSHPVVLRETYSKLYVSSYRQRLGYHLPLGSQRHLAHRTVHTKKVPSMLTFQLHLQSQAAGRKGGVEGTSGRGSIHWEKVRMAQGSIT